MPPFRGHNFPKPIASIEKTFLQPNFFYLRFHNSGAAPSEQKTSVQIHFIFVYGLGNRLGSDQSLIHHCCYAVVNLYNCMHHRVFYKLRGRLVYQAYAYSMRISSCNDQGPRITDAVRQQWRIEALAFEQKRQRQQCPRPLLSQNYKCSSKK